MRRGNFTQVSLVSPMLCIIVTFKTSKFEVQTLLLLFTLNCRLPIVESTSCILQGACSSTQNIVNALKCAAHTTSQEKTCYGLCSYYLPSDSDITTHNTDAILQAYRLLGLVLRLANFELNEIALGISGTAVVSSIAIPETVSLSSLQFQVSHNTTLQLWCSAFIVFLCVEKYLIQNDITSGMPLLLVSIVDANAANM